MQNPVERQKKHIIFFTIYCISIVRYIFNNRNMLRINKMHKKKIVHLFSLPIVLLFLAPL